MNWKTGRDILIGAVATTFLLVVSSLVGYGLSHFVDDLSVLIEWYKLNQGK